MRKLLAALLLLASLPAHGALAMYWERGTFGNGIMEIKRGPAVVLLDGPCNLRMGSAPEGLKWRAGFYATGARVIPLCWYEMPETAITVNYVQVVTEGGLRARIPRSWFELEGKPI